jgi:hypothetical protein
MPDIEGNEEFLRVGGKLNYQEKTPEFPEGDYKDGNIRFPGDVVLKDAIKAEIQIEKMLCHDYTTGLAISLNGNPFIEFPEAEGIPKPQEGYMHHFFPVVEVPLDYLKKGTENFLSLKVDTFQVWGWPQNLVYGVILRVYYEIKKENMPVIELPASKNTISLNQEILVNTKTPGQIKKVDYIAHCKDVNMEGDGKYTQ